MKSCKNRHSKTSRRKGVDCFEEHWGSETRWKSSFSRRDFNGRASSQEKRKHSITNKTLYAVNARDGTRDDRDAHVNTSLPLELASRRSSAPAKGRSTSKPLTRNLTFPKVMRSSVSSLGSIFKGAKRSAIVSQKVGVFRGRKPPAPVYQSTGTQTSLKRAIEKTERRGGTDRRGKSGQDARPVHPGNRVPTPDRSTPSIVRSLLENTRLTPEAVAELVEDYFHHGRRRHGTSSTSVRTRNSTTASSTTEESESTMRKHGHEEHHRSEPDRAPYRRRSSSTPETHSVRRRPRKTASDGSLDTIIINNEGHRSSKAVSRKLVSQLERLRAQGSRSRAVMPEYQEQRPKHQRKPSSPLNKEIKLPDVDNVENASDAVEIAKRPRLDSSPDVGQAHLQLYTPLEIPGVDTEVPDHLPFSPLCPLHPNSRSYGKFACPQHGPPKSNDHQAESEAETVGLKEILLEPNADIEGTIPDRPFNLNIPDHPSDSPLCPANLKHHPDGKGVCILHGRPHLPRSEDSDDSMIAPRAFVISK